MVFFNTVYDRTQQCRLIHIPDLTQWKKALLLFSYYHRRGFGGREKYKIVAAVAVTIDAHNSGPVMKNLSPFDNTNEGVKD